MTKTLTEWAADMRRAAEVIRAEAAKDGSLEDPAIVACIQGNEAIAADLETAENTIGCALPGLSPLGRSVAGQLGEQRGYCDPSRAYAAACSGPAPSSGGAA